MLSTLAIVVFVVSCCVVVMVCSPRSGGQWFVSRF